MSADARAATTIRRIVRQSPFIGATHQIVDDLEMIRQGDLWWHRIDIAIMSKPGLIYDKQLFLGE
jgi:hypothetical protein